MKSVSLIAILCGAFVLAACATGNGWHDQGEPASFTARLGQSVRAGDMVVKPLAIVEDSRCPSAVQCIQAGTVRLRVRAGSGKPASDITIELGHAVALDGRWLHLVQVCPYPHYPQSIAPQDYRFRFAINDSAVADPTAANMTCFN